MKNSEDDIIDDHLNGKVIDSCEYDAYSLEKLAEFLGDDTDY